MNERESGHPPNPAFFILGFPRSVTTCLGRILDAHPQVAVAPEIQWITDYFETRSGLDPQARIARELVVKWADQRRFEPFAISPEEVNGLVAEGELVPLGLFLTRLFNRYAQVRGKALVACQTPPECLRQLLTLHALWPAARFVQLIRDGRDVCRSVVNDQEGGHLASRFATWAADPVTAAALWWEKKVHKSRKRGRALGPGLYQEMRYEKLLARPARECARLCAFLGVPYDPAMLRPLEDLAVEETWLSAAEVERFEAAAGGLLDRLRYPRTVPQPRPELLQHAARLRAALNDPAVPRASPQAARERREQAGGTNPYVFIVGCPRSGTTLLQRLVSAHRDIAVHETFWIPYYFKRRIGLTPAGQVTSELIDRLFDYYRFYQMKIGRGELKELLRSGDPLSYAGFVTGLFNLYGEARGKPLAGDKTPDYVRQLPTLHSLWPTARFIHLIRDGRDVCLSAVNWKRKLPKLARHFTTWAEDPVTTAAAWWEWHVRQGQTAGQALGLGLYCEVRYEDVVARPAAECARLCDFLGVPYDPAMLRFHEGRTQAAPDLDAKEAWRPVTAGLRDWRSQMPAPDVERFEAAAGGLLDHLGYPRAVRRPRSDLLQHAATIREAFTEDARSWDDSLP